MMTWSYYLYPSPIEELNDSNIVCTAFEEKRSSIVAHLMEKGVDLSKPYGRHIDYIYRKAWAKSAQYHMICSMIACNLSFTNPDDYCLEITPFRSDRKRSYYLGYIAGLIKTKTLENRTGITFD